LIDASVYPVAAAVGVNKDSDERAHQLADAGVNIFVIDVAHGHHTNVRDMVASLAVLRETGKYEFDIIAGSIATAEAAKDLEDWGADGLRVGVGGGSVCETRTRTGIGVPQLQSVMETVAEAKVPVISDGGIRYPGDAAKALAAGADSIMIGSLFAGTDEAPGDDFIMGEWPDVREMKIYRGLASATTKLKYAGAASHVEGASKMVESRGPVGRLVKDIVDGITSSMSYVGASNLEEFRARSRFIKITPAGLAEAHPHGLKLVQIN
jgi:IMP dehydrogenase